MGCVSDPESTFGHINTWDVSRVTDMGEIFSYEYKFNEPLHNWDVSSVTDTRNMFVRAKKFNQDLNSWDVSSVTSMNNMFEEAHDFNQPLNSWDVCSVTEWGLNWNQLWYQEHYATTPWIVSSWRDQNCN